ncbi:MAG TPA: hypothetical protein VNQ76_13290 [Planctomicrobium sp.]|nr:hypothetical protein [Planctomicrobium sp.]
MGETVGTNAAELLVESRLRTSFQNVLPGAVIDPATFMALIGGLIQLIRGCRNPESAASHLKRGSATAFLAAREKFKKEGYSRIIAARMARDLVNQAKGLNDDEIDLLVEEAKDVPNTNVIWPV